LRASILKKIFDRGVSYPEIFYIYDRSVLRDVGGMASRSNMWNTIKIVGFALVTGDIHADKLD